MQPVRCMSRAMTGCIAYRRCTAEVAPRVKPWGPRCLSDNARRRNRRVVRSTAEPAHRETGLPRLRAGAAAGHPSQATHRRGRRDATAHRAHRCDQAHSRPGEVPRAKRRRKYGRSLGESRVRAAGSRSGRSCSPAVPPPDRATSHRHRHFSHRTAGAARNRASAVVRSRSSPKRSRRASSMRR